MEGVHLKILLAQQQCMGLLMLKQYELRAHGPYSNYFDETKYSSVNDDTNFKI
jgi:hypothetical protein